MTRNELIAKLQQHRDNDVRVRVPSEAGDLVLDLHSVGYNQAGDFITIVTEEHFGPDVVLLPSAAGFAVSVDGEPVYEGSNPVDMITAIVGAIGGTVSTNPEDAG